MRRVSQVSHAKVMRGIEIAALSAQCEIAKAALAAYENIDGKDAAGYALSTLLRLDGLTESLSAAQHEAEEGSQEAYYLSWEWDGQSVNEIGDEMLHVFPETLAGHCYANTVPVAYRGLVWSGVEGMRGCRYAVRIFAIDKKGMALMGSTLYWPVEDVDSTEYCVLPAADAFEKVEEYRRSNAATPG